MSRCRVHVRYRRAGGCFVKPMFRYMLLFCLGMSKAQNVMADTCDRLLDSVEADWHAGKVAEVARKLGAEETQCAGRVRYDLVLGEALLASGHPADALMPLERAVALAPDDKASWRALAQAWLLLGDREAALAVRHAMRGVSTVPAAGTAVDFHWLLSLEGGRGHDSNATQATSDSGVVVPALGGVRILLNPLSRQNGDGYWASALRADGQWGVSADTNVRLRLSDLRKDYDELRGFSTDERSLAASVEHAGRYGDWSYGIQYSQFLQGGDLVRRSLDGNLAWQPVHASLWWPTFGLEVGAYRYKGGKQAVDGFVEKMISVGNTFPLGKNTIGWSVLAGRDFATVRRADGDRDIVGMRLSATGPLTGTLDWFGWFDRIGSRYRDANPAFMVRRYEELTGLTGGLSWTLARGLSVRGQVSFARQHSNIPLYDYRLADSSLTLHYEFGG